MSNNLDHHYLKKYNTCIGKLSEKIGRKALEAKLPFWQYVSQLQYILVLLKLAEMPVFLLPKSPAVRCQVE